LWPDKPIAAEMEPIYQLIRREREGDQIDICMAIGGAKAKQFGKWSVNRDLTYIIYYCICQKIQNK